MPSQREINAPLSAVVTSWPAFAVLSFFHPFCSVLFVVDSFSLLFRVRPSSSESSPPPPPPAPLRDAAPSFSCLLLCKLLSALPLLTSPPPPRRRRRRRRSGNSLPPFSARFRLIAHSSSRARRGPAIPHPLPSKFRTSEKSPSGRRGPALRGRLVIFG